MISHKCQYSLRAVFELGKQRGNGPVKIAEIAKAQAIPTRFLESILNQLKQGGFVESRRGREGGYLLTDPPARIKVGEIIRFIEGPIAPVECVEGESGCPLRSDCVFLPMYKKVSEAVSDVYDGTTFQDLMDQEEKMTKRYVADFNI